MSLKLMSLFDGSGGFPLAASLCGFTPVYASEVEPYPIAVTRSRFPDMVHIGDVSKVNGAELEPVDIISFGSPCQDLSVAGLRKGMKHEENGDDETTRSGLFMEAIRIIREMREATNGKYPTFAIWENVTGAFSSNGGEDFRMVLESFIRTAEPNAPALPGVDGGRGQNLTLSWETNGALLTELSMLNTGEYPSVGEECTLSQILEDDAPTKYYLSANACTGILRRSEQRGKKLPEILEKALKEQATRSKFGGVLNETAPGAKPEKVL